MSQQLLVNKHHGLHDSKFNLAKRKFGSGHRQKKNNKPRVEHEARSAHGHTLNKTMRGKIFQSIVAMY